MEANRQVTERQTKDNLENGEEYVGLTKIPYQNLMLDTWILRIWRKICKAHVVFTTRGGIAWSMD